VPNGADDRLLVITGPCSVHDPQATLEYAVRLAAMGLTDELLIVMRAYPEKPRTVTSWTGLLNDPALDGSRDVRRGLREARQLLVSLAALGVPAACEWVNPVIPAYLADAVTWSAIGARTTESQVHRHVASSLPMPVGFKNATDGTSGEITRAARTRTPLALGIIAGRRVCAAAARPSPRPYC
jgi:3-deoxy-7-phosphoheptulonate synthase